MPLKLKPILWRLRLLSNEIQLKTKQLKLVKLKQQMHEELPHVYGFPWYSWAWEFFNCEKKVALLCAANQISKSSTQIRTAIDWATNVEKWSKLWPKLNGRVPNLFWYMYPSKDVATTEFHKKWVTEFLPRGDMKNHPIYGWHATFEKKQIESIEFNSGVSIQFKTYSQDVHKLQASSVYAVFGDEEMPEDMYDEIMFRTEATEGYFRLVFTATIGQEFWWQAIEAIGTDKEKLVGAWKRQISMYDCLQYRDGSASPWTIDKIKQIEARCRSKAEILRRVYGRFIKDEGRKYHAFDPTRHYVNPRPIPKNWSIYSGVDIGSGGKSGHPSAIIFIAVSPDLRSGLIVDGWRGDGIETTSGDVLDKYKEMCVEMPELTMQSYDFAAKDFGTIALRKGIPFIKAKKDHALGEDVINTLLKNDMLFIFDTPELRKLGGEMLKLNLSTPKNKAKDDFCDAARYGIVSIPWDFSDLKVGEETEEGALKPLSAKELIEHEINERRGLFEKRGGDDLANAWGVSDDISFWNEEYGN